MGSLKDKLTKMKYKMDDKVYCMIPNSTLESMMGSERWGRIVKAVQRKHKTGIIICERRRIPVLRVGSTDGPLLGSVAKAERWAKKVLKKD